MRVHGLDLRSPVDESDGSGTVPRDRAAWNRSRSRTPPAPPEAADFFTRSRGDRGQKSILNFVFFVVQYTGFHFFRDYSGNEKARD